MKLAVISHCALGDFVLTTLPIVGGLRRKYPDAHIDVFTPNNSFHDLARYQANWTDGWICRTTRLPTLSASYDHIYIIGGPADAAAAFQGLPVTIVETSPPKDVHATIHAWDQVRELAGCIVEQPRIIFTELDQVNYHFGDFMPRIVIHPGAGGRFKRWPHFRALVEKLDGDPTREITIVHGPGPGEDQLAWDIAQGRSQVNVRRFTHAREFAAFCADSELYIGNDSGASHVAAATGCPCIILYGPTDPDVWAPLNEKVFRLSAQWACVKHQHAELQPGVCDMCSSGDAACSSGEPPCLKTIAPDTVYQEAMMIWELMNQ